MSEILLARKNQYLIVGDKEKEILIGSILGDASILKRGMIQFEQGTNQKAYLEWKYQELKSIISGKKIYQVKRYKANGEACYSYKFTTRQYFRPWRAKFYPKGEKIINHELVKQITPLGLAVWYMDDGCLINKYSCVIATDSFNQESVSSLRTILKDKFSIDTRVRDKISKTKQKQQRLCIGGKNMVKFFNLIRPYIIPSMQYKLTDPVTTQSIRRRNMHY